MRSFALLIATLFAVVAGTASQAQTTSTTTIRESYVCAQCGKIHYRNVTAPVTTQASVTPVASTPTTIAPVTYVDGGSTSQGGSVIQSVPVAASSAMQASGGVVNVLSNLNAQRAQRGLGALVFDPQLQAVAERRARKMAAGGLKNHPPGSFAPGRYEGVGWSSSYSPSKVSACFTSDSRMRYAGAAMATGRDGVYFAVVYR